MVAMQARWWRAYSLVVTAVVAFYAAAGWVLANRALAEWPDDV